MYWSMHISLFTITPYYIGLLTCFTGTALCSFLIIFFSLEQSLSNSVELLNSLIKVQCHIVMFGFSSVMDNKKLSLVSEASLRIPH